MTYDGELGDELVRRPSARASGALAGAVAPSPHSRYTTLVHIESVELTITGPAFLADAGAAERARLLLLLDAVRSERMTWRAAADALGIAPDRLLDLAKAHGVPVVRYESANLSEDLSTLDRLQRRASGT